ncbi:MAG: right-handed parallel beta-helix repeat-containing protein [Rikenellaceae bacterium]
MKRLYIIGALLTLSFSVSAQTELHVSPTAKANGNGTLESPFNTIEAAKERVAKINKRMQEDIVVYLHAGSYNITSPILFNEEDSGQNGHTITYKAYQDETPQLSGGVKVAGWERVDGNIYKANLDRDTKLRTLFVNGVRARMAGTNDPIDGVSDWGTYEVTGDEPWAFGAGTGIDGVRFKSEDVRVYSNPEDVELVQNNVWTEKILCIRDIEYLGEHTILKFQQPYGAIATNMAWAGAIKYDKQFVVRNAYELLDAEGEFYFNRATKTLYYYSSEVDMSSAEVIAPTSEGLIRIEGSSNESRVRNLRFEGITFSHDHWQLMEIEGSHAFAGIQSSGLAYKFVPGGNWHPTEYNSCDVPRGSIEVKSAENITFEQNRFEGMGSAIAINMVNDVKNSTINGNYFHDLLGNAVNIGHPQHYKIGDGAHFKSGVEGLCEYINVTNNYLRNVSVDFRQLEGITAFFVANVKIDHNDIADTAYGAITMGWWWGNSEIPPSKVAHDNSMSFNKAGNTHLALKDGGILYFLGEQPRTIVEENYIYNGQRCIYPDDGSAYLTIRRNVVMNNTPKGVFWLHIWRDNCHDIVSDGNFVKDNNVKNNGRNCPVTNTQSFMTDKNFSDEAKAIIAAAGLEAKYRHIIPAKKSKLIELYPSSFKDTDH